MLRVKRNEKDNAAAQQSSKVMGLLLMLPLHASIVPTSGRAATKVRPARDVMK